MVYNQLLNGVYWGYNPLTYHLLSPWDFQVERFLGGPKWVWKNRFFLGGISLQKQIAINQGTNVPMLFIVFSRDSSE